MKSEVLDIDPFHISRYLNELLARRPLLSTSRSEAQADRGKQEALKQGACCIAACLLCKSH
jgi:hypothetical protein